MTQIAYVESGKTYQQFANRPNPGETHAEYPYKIVDNWPVESAVTKKSKHRGAHIGLMQVPVTQQDAWDWIQNTKDGVTTGTFSFQTTLNNAYSLEGTINWGLATLCLL